MIKSFKKSFKTISKNPNTIPINLSIILLILIFLAYESIFITRIYPKVYIGDMNVSFMSKSQAYQLISHQFNNRSTQKLTFTFNSKNYTIDISELSPNLNYQEAIDEAFTLGHSGPPWKRLQDQGQSLLFQYIVTPKVSLNLSSQLEKLSQEIGQEPEDASIWLDDNNQVHITSGSIGLELDQKGLQAQVQNYLLFGVYSPQLPVKNIDPNFTDQEAQIAKKALENIQQNPVKLNYKDQVWTIDVPTLFHLLNLSNNDSLLDTSKLDNYLKDLSNQINQPVEEALFKFDENQQKVTQFQPAQEGLELDINQTKKLLLGAIEGTGEKNITLPVKVIQPKIKTDEVNNLGIKELIGRGVSNFAGSIPNRIYNVGLTASRINGVLVPPGEIFSFNRTVGDISAATGFKQAYVIKEGRTVLDDGGGVCQDSTTLFRAVLNAGLPIVKRTAHAYRVGYYEQGFPPGLDATVFYPSVDFQFKNDTSGYILIQAHTQGTTLYIDLYGTSDGRVATLTKSIIASQTPPPPELRQDDPTLPRGQVKQVDWAAWGAQVSFKRTVTRNGEILADELWRSNYKPWQAVYLVGTKD